VTVRGTLAPVASEEQFDSLFNDICVRLGFCLPPRDIAGLKQEPPPDAESFTNAVLRAEGFDPPELCDLRLRRQVRDAIRVHLDLPDR